MNPARDNVHPILVSSVDNTADVALICTPDLIVERLNLVARSFLAIDRGTSLLTVVNPADAEMLGDAISREEGTILHARINQAGPGASAGWGSHLLPCRMASFGTCGSWMSPMLF